MPPQYHQVSTKSVARGSELVDPWFLGRFGLNLYRGCEHACCYCDGRAERYRVSGDFSKDIQVKGNAPEVLAQELGKLRESGFVLLGGGVCDSYQPAEAEFCLARSALQLVRAHNLSVHVLTKSALVERDFDLLVEINAKQRAILSFSITSTDELIRERFEPGAAPFAERLRLLRRAKDLGLGTGVMAMPLLPGLSDQAGAIEGLARAVQASGADFICCGGLTLRPGVQKQAYFDAIERHHPGLLDGYRRLYREERASGMPDSLYSARLEERIRAAHAAIGLPGRIPWQLFRGQLPLYAEVGVLLEHRGFEFGEAGSGGGPCARAGMAIQQWARGRIRRSRSRSAYKEVESELVWASRMGSLAETVGIDPEIAGTVEEILGRVLGSPRQRSKSLPSSSR